MMPLSLPLPAFSFPNQLPFCLKNFIREGWRFSFELFFRVFLCIANFDLSAFAPFSCGKVLPPFTCIWPFFSNPNPPAASGFSCPRHATLAGKTFFFCFHRKGFSLFALPFFRWAEFSSSFPHW